ncbi:hypothetical protein RRG08_042027 [Elysia crispata]|uniref:Uncharacterized protein n=1 Tax=Elysia crispata TaxID=231223 RepID=A0AAE1DBV3_9GAST|nr:hypothetical protein RRG08_042027 [Elysia crispata]
MCGNRCSDWEALQNQSVKDKGCWDLNGGVYDKTTENCISKCWHISLPCYDACSIAYETCEKLYPLGQKPDCFFSCYDNTFKQIKLTLPTK